MKKKTFIVSTYNNYEWIKTEQAYCKLFLLLKYYRKDYQVWDYPLWLVKFMKDKFNISLNWGNKNCNIELFVPNTGQVTWYTPW